nr:prepilin peptidase [Deltaproteobacteria bacterium]
VGEIYFRITKREGLGLGDGMLLAVVGALLGWKGVFVSLFGGAVLGSVMGIFALLAARRNAAEAEPNEGDKAESEGDDEADDAPSLMRTELPFGPFLAMAAVFYLFAEPYLTLHFRVLQVG